MKCFDINQLSKLIHETTFYNHLQIGRGRYDGDTVTIYVSFPLFDGSRSIYCYYGEKENNIHKNFKTVEELVSFLVNVINTEKVTLVYHRF
jgi:hypothetical protein